MATKIFPKSLLFVFSFFVFLKYFMLNKHGLLMQTMQNAASVMFPVPAFWVKILHTGNAQAIAL
jgi:hypothetical protein